jgi:hypothetical protein
VSDGVCVWVQIWITRIPSCGGRARCWRSLLQCSPPHCWLTWGPRRLGSVGSGGGFECRALSYEWCRQLTHRGCVSQVAILMLEASP